MMKAHHTEVNGSKAVLKPPKDFTTTGRTARWDVFVEAVGENRATVSKFEFVLPVWVHGLLNHDREADRVLPTPPTTSRPEEVEDFGHYDRHDWQAPFAYLRATETVVTRADLWCRMAINYAQRIMAGLDPNEMFVDYDLVDVRRADDSYIFELFGYDLEAPDSKTWSGSAEATILRRGDLADHYDD